MKSFDPLKKDFLAVSVLTLGSIKPFSLPLVLWIVLIYKKNIGVNRFKNVKVKLIECLSRLIDKGNHLKFFSVPESLVFKICF